MATETTKLTFVEGAAASTPAASRAVIYSKSDGLMYSKDDAGVETLMSAGSAGSVATDPIWDAAGDLVQGTGANTAAKLSAGTAAMFLKSAGAAAANLWAFPPGYELDYVARTTSTSVTATTEAGADTCITGTSQAYPAVPMLIEFSCDNISPDPAAAGRYIVVSLWDGGTSLGSLGFIRTPAAGDLNIPLRVSRRITPTAATHQYIIKSFVNVGTGTIGAGAGGNGLVNVAYLRITLV